MERYIEQDLPIEITKFPSSLACTLTTRSGGPQRTTSGAPATGDRLPLRAALEQVAAYASDLPGKEERPVEEAVGVQLSFL